ncbi:MAG: outer membrane protein assembly factor BamD, partial [Calditrichia bacterium]
MKKVLLTVFFLAISSLVFAQQSEQSMFENGLDAYRNKDFNTAQNIFFKLLKEHPGGRLETITKLMLAKAYYKQENFSAVEIIANNFFIKFPNSAYLDDMHHLLGNTYFRSEKYDEAIGQWLWVVNNSSDQRLKELAGSYLIKTMDNFL